MKKIIVYINSNCIHCQMYVKYLLKKNIHFAIKDIYQNQKVVEELYIKNVLTVPVLFADDNFVIGFDNKKIENII